MKKINLKELKKRDFFGDTGLNGIATYVGNPPSDPENWFDFVLELNDGNHVMDFGDLFCIDNEDALERLSQTIKKLSIIEEHIKLSKEKLIELFEKIQ